MLIALLFPLAATAANYGSGGQFVDAEWDGNLNPTAPRTVTYNGALYWSGAKLPSSGPGHTETECRWIVRRSSDGMTFNLGDLSYDPTYGKWDELTGTISLRHTFEISPWFSGIEVYTYSVAFADGAAVGIFEGINAVNSGDRAALRMKSLNQDRLAGLAGRVQLATGVEATARTLCTFTGQRNWSFIIDYNSCLARSQGDYSAMGHGWNHNFQAKVVSGTVPEVRWNATTSSKFDVVIDSTTYGSTEDNARYDRLENLGTGGWRLTRRDQSILLFDTGGKLTEDRDPQGRTLALTHTGNLLTLIRDPISGTQLTLGYDGNSLLHTLTDAESRVVTLNITGPSDNRLLTSIVNQNSKTTTLDYDAQRRLETLTDHTNVTLTTNVYDSYGRVVSQDDANTGNHLMAFAYEEAGTPGSVIYAPSDTGHTTPIPVPFIGAFPSRADSATNFAGQTVTYAYDATSGRLLSATLGSAVTYVGYDSAGNITSITDPSSVTTPVAPVHKTTVTDRNNKQWVYTFDPNYNLLSVKDPLDQVTSYTYDTGNRVLTVTDPIDHTSTFTYYSGTGENGLLHTATDAEGKTTTYTYDSHNNPDKITDHDGHETDFDFNTDNTLHSVTDAQDKTTTWAYGTNAPNPDTMTLPEGGVVHYDTYASGRLTQMTDPNGVITKFDYYANGGLKWREDHAGKRTLFDYDYVGNLRHLTTSDPDATATGAGKDPYVTEYQYDHRNRLLKIIAPDGGETNYGYDDANNQKTIANAFSKVTTLYYEGEDRLWKIVSPDPYPGETGVGKDPLVTEYHYNDAGHLDWIKDPAGKQTTFTPDAAGRLDYVSNPLSHGIDYHYNDRNLPDIVTDPLNHATNLSYDNQGRLYTSTDPLQRTTTFDRDEIGRLYKVTDQGGLVSEQGFDDDGHLETLKNPAGVAVTFHYTNSRLDMETTPEGRHTDYGYNSRGLLWTVTEPSTQAVTLTYDDAQLLKSRADGLGTITYGRDAGGRVSTIVEGNRTITRVYTLLGQLDSYTVAISGGATNTIGYLYDDAGRLKKVTYPGTPTKEVHYTYDEAGRLHTVKDWSDRVTTYTYYDDGRLKETIRQNLTKQLREYDAAGRLEHLKEYAPNGTTILYSGDYRYDEANQLTGETINPAYVPVFFTHSQTFDNDNRLLTHNGESVTIDPDGNLTAIAIAAGVSPESYGYDIRNRLQTAGALTYNYDAENRRVAQTDGTNTTTYVINPNAALDQVLMKTVGGVTTYYVYGLGLLHEEAGGVVRYYHFDRRGDTVAFTDSSGTVTGRVAYGVFGEMVSSSGTLATPFLFNGRWGVQTDANGLYYHRARYYHPGLRRFLNQDVMLGSITNGASMNRFAYANGNPVSMIDPFGLMAKDPDAWGIGYYANQAGNFAGEISGYNSYRRAQYSYGEGDYFDAAGWGLAGIFEEGTLFMGGAAIVRRAEALTSSLWSRFTGNGAAENVAEGSFSITKRGWQGYPSNPNVPKPEGPFRLLQGAEQDAARNAANNANRAAHRADPSLAGKQIHEIQPVKFGGSPTDAANKVPLTPQEHTPFTTWWRQLLLDLER